MGINLLTLDIGNPRNLGLIMRQSYVLAGENCKLFIFDPRKVLESEREQIRQTSVGLSDSANYEAVGNLKTFLDGYDGRVIAADINPGETPLQKFVFQEEDLIIFGNENTGLMDKKLKRWQGLENIDSYVIIPMLGKNYAKPQTERPVSPNHEIHPNLNVAAAADIVLYTALQQLGHYSDFSYEKIRG